jgi:hypothetical protein
MTCGVYWGIYYIKIIIWDKLQDVVQKMQLLWVGVVVQNLS